MMAGPRTEKLARDQVSEAMNAPLCHRVQGAFLFGLPLIPPEVMPYEGACLLEQIAKHVTAGPGAVRGIINPIESRLSWATGTERACRMDQLD